MKISISIVTIFTLLIIEVDGATYGNNSMNTTNGTKSMGSRKTMPHHKPRVYRCGQEQSRHTTRRSDEMLKRFTTQLKVFIGHTGFDSIAFKKATKKLDKRISAIELVVKQNNPKDQKSIQLIYAKQLFRKMKWALGTIKKFKEPSPLHTLIRIIVQFNVKLMALSDPFDSQTEVGTLNRLSELLSFWKDDFDQIGDNSEPGKMIFDSEYTLAKTALEKLRSNAFNNREQREFNGTSKSNATVIFP